VPNGFGAPPTYRVADLTNPILQPWTIPSMKKANEEVLAGKVPFRARERCWPVRRDIPMQLGSRPKAPANDAGAFFLRRAAVAEPPCRFPSPCSA
jgi:hypothetical protein